MDNDSRVKKVLVKIYREAKIRFDYRGMNLLREEAGNACIAEALKKSVPFMVGRFGAVEMHLVAKWMQQRSFSENEKDQALYAAGIFPNDDITLIHFCELYTQEMKQCDILGVWEVASEKQAIKQYCKAVQLIPSRAIEPYYFDTPWSAELEGKRILIVHPFVSSIKRQLLQRELLWPGKCVLPEFGKVSYIKAIQSNAGGATEFHDWFEALDWMKRQIDQTEFDIAIVGAGAYGFPLCAYIKEKGKIAIQMSGATQILFGIKGKRWDDHHIISKFYNDNWIRPDQSETPPSIHKVEGGSYW